MNVTWTMTGYHQLYNAFGRLHDGLKHNKPTLTKAGLAYYKHVGEIFDTEGASAGLYWPDLSERRIQERNGNAHPILEWMGDLRSAATTMGIHAGPDILGGQRIVDNHLRLYLQGDKAGHNSGFQNDAGFHVPKREFWPWYDEQHDLVFKPFESFVDDWLNNP